MTITDYKIVMNEFHKVQKTYDRDALKKLLDEVSQELIDNLLVRNFEKTIQSVSWIEIHENIINRANQDLFDNTDSVLKMIKSYSKSGLFKYNPFYIKYILRSIIKRTSQGVLNERNTVLEILKIFPSASVEIFEKTEGKYDHDREIIKKILNYDAYYFNKINSKFKYDEDFIKEISLMNYKIVKYLPSQYRSNENFIKLLLNHEDTEKKLNDEVESIKNPSYIYCVDSDLLNNKKFLIGYFEYLETLYNENKKYLIDKYDLNDNRGRTNFRIKEKINKLREINKDIVVYIIDNINNELLFDKDTVEYMLKSNFSSGLAFIVRCEDFTLEKYLFEKIEHIIFETKILTRKVLEKDNYKINLHDIRRLKRLHEDALLDLKKVETKLEEKEKNARRRPGLFDYVDLNDPYIADQFHHD